MNRLLRALSWALGGLALLSFGLGLAASAGLFAAGELRADTPSRSFGVAVPGQAIAIDFPLTNGTGRTVRILGGTSSCGLFGCVEANGLPMEIPPSATRSVRVDYRAGGVGEGRMSVVIYTDDPAHPELTLDVTGRVVGRLDAPAPSDS